MSDLKARAEQFVDEYADEFLKDEALKAILAFAQEERRLALEEAATVAEGFSKPPYDRQWWFETTQEEISAQIRLEVAAAIRQVKEA